MHRPTSPFKEEARRREKSFSGKGTPASKEPAALSPPKSPVIVRRNLEELKRLNPIQSGQRSPPPPTIPKDLLVEEPIPIPVKTATQSTHRRPQFADRHEPRSVKKSEDSFKNAKPAIVTASGQLVEIRDGLKNFDTKLRTPSPEELNEIMLSKCSPVFSHLAVETPAPLTDSSSKKPEHNVMLASVKFNGSHPASSEANDTCSKPNRNEETLEPELSVDDLESSLNAYDGTPIFIVPSTHYDVVSQTFRSGMYGLDTESDCFNGELRILQVYTGSRVYIFPVDVLDRQIDSFFIKFLKSKDRIKVGVDLDGDVYKIKKYVQTRRHCSQEEQIAKYKFTVNGTIDVQSIARSFEEKGLSLEKLAYRYVEDFSKNPSDLGNYLEPTPSQYIYAANDAVLSLKIYFPLVKRIPCPRWQSLQTGVNSEPVTPKKEKSSLLMVLEEFETTESYHSSQEQSPSTGSMISSEDDSDNKESSESSARNDNDSKPEEGNFAVAEPNPSNERTPVNQTPKKKTASLPLSKKKSRQKNRNRTEGFDRMLEAERKKNAEISKQKSKKSSHAKGGDQVVLQKSISPERKESIETIRAKLKDKIKDARQRRAEVQFPTLPSVSVVKNAPPTSLKAVPAERLEVKFRDSLRKFKSDYEGYTNEEKRAILTALVGDRAGEAENVLMQTIDSLDKLTAAISDCDYYTILSQLCALCLNLYSTGAQQTASSVCFRYADVVNMVANDIQLMKDLFPRFETRFLAANVFVSLACDNDHLAITAH